MKGLNKEQLEYLNLLKENLDDNAKWLRQELEEIGIPSHRQVANICQYAAQITDSAKSLHALILKGEY